MRDADKELAALAKQGVQLDPATEQAFRAVLEAESLTVDVAQKAARVLKTPGFAVQPDVAMVPKPVPKPVKRGPGRPRKAGVK